MSNKDSCQWIWHINKNLYNLLLTSIFASFLWATPPRSLELQCFWRSIGSFYIEFYKWACLGWCFGLSRALKLGQVYFLPRIASFIFGRNCVNSERLCSFVKVRHQPLAGVLRLTEDWEAIWYCRKLSEFHIMCSRTKNRVDLKI